MAQLVLNGLSLELGDPPVPVLSRISFSCEPGTVTLLLGPNGCGKSVLLRTILGLCPGYSGTIAWDGSVLSRQFRRLHGQSGVVFQNPEQQIFGATVREDLLAGQPRDTVIDQVILQELGLTELLLRSPAELSGGQRRRLALAGAFVGNRRILFLDEPFLELDYPAVEGLVRLVIRFRDAGGIVVVASHETRDIWPLTDRVVLLVNGVVRFSGSRDDAAGVLLPEYGLRPLAAPGAPPA